METTTNGTTVCGKCLGSGKYHFRFPARTEECFPCAGSGQVEASTAKPRAIRITPMTRERAELDLRAILRNARDGRCEWSDVNGDDRSCMYVPGQFELLLGMVSPMAREAFRALGWPV